MIIQLKQLFEITGQSLDIDQSISPQELSDSPLHEAFAAPVRIVGSIKNRAGVVTLDYTVTALLHCVCDRCLKAFDRQYSFSLTHTLVRDLAGGEESEEEYDDYIVCPDNTLDLTELSSSDLLLGLPTKILCKEDCAGLCPQCGADLNDGDCGCSA